MIRKTMVMAAALALAATQVRAEGGGGGSGSGSGAGGQAAGRGGERGGAGEERGVGTGQGGDQAAAAQEAPSVTGTEGAGGKRPHPQAQGTGDDRRFGNAPAQESGQAGRPATQPMEVSGRVALVNAADHELAIDAGTATTQIKVAPDAEITVDGKRGSLEDIRQGTQVRASLERSGDETHAKRIEVTSSASKK